MSEMKVLSQLWVQLGAVGVLIIVLCFSIWQLSKYMVKNEKYHRDEISDITSKHREERANWNETNDERTNKIIEVVEKNSTVMTELCTIIKTKHE